MSYLTEHKRKFDDLRIYLENQDDIRKGANGGNSILFSYPPDEEKLYIEEAKEVYREKASFIDISKLLVDFIDEIGWENFREYYQDYRSTPNVIFNTDNIPLGLFQRIIKEIECASNGNKIPFLVRTGCLYGTGIENVNIMEHKKVMTLPHPLVIFYPSLLEGNNLYFLNFKPASKYRCVLVK